MQNILLPGLSMLLEFEKKDSTGRLIESFSITMMKYLEFNSLFNKILFL